MALSNPLQRLCGCLIALSCAALAPTVHAAADLADALSASRLGAPAYAQGCRRAAAGTPVVLARWRAASELLWGVHPVRALRNAARDCQARLDKVTAQPVSADPAGTKTDTIVASRLELARLERDFERRLTERQPRLVFTRAELDGLPTEWLEAHGTPRGDRFSFGVGLADYYPFLRMAKRQSARERMYVAHANRGGKANLHAMQQIVTLRRTLARAEGFRSHYERVTQGLDLPAAEEAKKFLDTIEPGIQVAANADLAALRLENANMPVRRWDALYLLEQARRKFVGQGDNDPGSMLPAEQMVPWLLAYFGPLAGVGFEPASAPAWHPAVRCFRVSTGSTGSTGDSTAQPPFLGNLCLDLYPRPGKYYNYATYIVPAAGPPSAERLVSVVANLDPVRLSPDEVERSFAEFSIALASLICKTPTCLPGGSSDTLWQVQRSLFEQIAFSDEALGVLSRAVPGARPMDPEAMARVRLNRHFGAGLNYARHLMMSRYDLELNTAVADIDVMKRWIELENASGLPHEPGTFYPSRLNVIAGAGAGLYYTSIWWAATGIDLFDTLRDRTLDPDISRRMREAFFDPTRTTPSSERFRLLVGREVNVDSLLGQIASHTIPQMITRLGGMPAASR